MVSSTRYYKLLPPPVYLNKMLIIPKTGNNNFSRMQPTVFITIFHFCVNEAVLEEHNTCIYILRVNNIRSGQLGQLPHLLIRYDKKCFKIIIIYLN